MPLIEVIANSTKTEKPGWVYVPDTGFDPTKAPIQPGARKRNARIQDNREAGLTTRQSAALAKRLAELDKDNSRDLVVPLPSKADGKRDKPRNAATKKIIESQRTFAHYLAEEEALGTNEYEAPAAKSRTGRPKGSAPTPSRPAQTAPPSNVQATKAAAIENSASDGATPSTQSAQDVAETRLMQVLVPQAPSEALMEALTAAPPLRWNAARAKPSTQGKPQRYFCELCGYWGRARCLQCGARLCGLSCKKAHDEGRCQKYGG